MNCQFLTTNGVMGAAKYVVTFLYIKNIHIFVHNLQLSRQCNLTKEFRCLVEKCKTGHCCHSLKNNDYYMYMFINSQLYFILFIDN